MKKIVSMIFLLGLFSSLVYSQTSIPGSIYLFGSGNQIVKITIIKNKKEGKPTYDYGIYAIGKEFEINVSDSTNKVYRTYFVFDLNSIPINAAISQVTVHFSTGNIGSYSLKLTQVTSVSTDKGANWNAIASGNSLHSGIAYNGSSFVSSPIKNAMQQSLANRQLIIGALCEQENTNGSYSSMTLNLDVNYTRPAMQLSLQARNDLEGGNGGNIGVGIYPASPISQPSPYPFTAFETQKLNLAAYDIQTVGSYTWIFNDGEAPLNLSEWKKDIFGAKTSLGNTSSITSPQLTTNDNGASFVAYLKKICNLTFSSPGGYVYVNNYLYTSPKVIPLVKLNSATAEGQWYYSNGIEYNFNHWTSGGQSFSSPFTATEHKTYTAVYVGKPSNIGKYAGCSGNTGDPILLTWIDNPNTAVNQYQIWRRVRHNGVVGNPVLLTTVGRGVQSYTDYDYVWTNGYTDDLLQYNVREYYSTEGTYSDPDYVSAFGRMEVEIDNSLSEKNTRSLVIPTEYSITNYPNPFNPTTTINYQLPQDGFVTIKVYDMLGKEITTLVNENKSAGYYRVDFNAGKLTSGVYICTIIANNFIQSRKILLMK